MSRGFLAIDRAALALCASQDEAVCLFLMTRMQDAAWSPANPAPAVDVGRNYWSQRTGISADAFRRLLDRLVDGGRAVVVHPGDRRTTKRIRFLCDSSAPEASPKLPPSSPQPTTATNAENPSILPTFPQAPPNPSPTDLTITPTLTSTSLKNTQEAPASADALTDRSQHEASASQDCPQDPRGAGSPPHQPPRRAVDSGGHARQPGLVDNRHVEAAATTPQRQPSTPDASGASSGMDPSMGAGSVRIGTGHEAGTDGWGNGALPVLTAPTRPDPRTDPAIAVVAPVERGNGASPTPPTKPDGAPAWTPARKDCGGHDRWALAEMVLTVLGQIRAPVDAKMADTPIPALAGKVQTAAPVVLGLWKADGKRDPAEFGRDLVLVARAARWCPDPIFARDIRAEGWANGTNRCQSVGNICRQKPKGDSGGATWDERLEAARKWEADGFPTSAPAAPQTRPAFMSRGDRLNADIADAFAEIARAEGREPEADPSPRPGAVDAMFKEFL